jgi:hypothetical protein
MRADPVCHLDEHLLETDVQDESMDIAIRASMEVQSPTLSQ